MPYRDKKKDKECQRQWRLDNPNYDKQYRLSHKDKIEVYEKHRRCDNKEMRLEQHRQYSKTLKGKAAKQRTNTKRRAKEREIINTLTANEWIDILKEYKFKCAYCGKEFTLFDRETKDHVIPISKGGDNIKENIVPACQSCNSSKGNKTF